MPRPARVIAPGVPLHIIQRGNDRMPMFREPSDQAFFLGELGSVFLSLSVDVHAYVLMTNHVHVLATPRDEHGPSRAMQRLGGRYVRYFNTRYSRTGTLWEGRFRSAAVESDRYFLACCRYIELNPVRAGLVGHPGDYVWSSYRANALGSADRLLTPHAIYEALGPTRERRRQAYRDLFRSALGDSDVHALRMSIAGPRAMLSLASPNDSHPEL